MLNKVTAYSSRPGDAPIIFNLVDIPDTDLYVMRNIDGIDSAKANINTTPFASGKGSGYTGSNVPDRNIVLTVGFNPDWDVWSYEALRQKLDLYFMTNTLVRLVFETDEKPPVEISGYVESNSISIFSKDPETQISIICPEADFVAVDSTIITGAANADSTSITYNGTVETPIDFTLTHISGGYPTDIQMHSDDSIFHVNDSSGTGGHDFIMKSIPGNKHVMLSTGASLLAKVVDGSSWLNIVPGSQDFSVDTNNGNQNWALTYYERYGSL